MHENVEMPFNSSRLCRRLLYTSFRHYFLIHLFEEDTLMFIVKFQKIQFLFAI
uniref:Uncharacterized protein n=1 Tax=Siphoviridae sp. ctrfD19 TaxID=2826478 RepID=A0A8S5M2C1_9CAUD|nr:MAG TPA: hypothetical protein [Siphoviridae sp. ctrfD19]